MAEQVDRFNNDPVKLRAEIARLEQEIQRLRNIIGKPGTVITLQPNGNLQKVLQVRGRDVTDNLSVIARKFSVSPSTACRWAAASKLEKHTDSSGTYYFLDQSRPTRRKKSQ
jgi:hypothetical protein